MVKDEGSVFWPNLFSLLPSHCLWNERRFADRKRVWNPEEPEPEDLAIKAIGRSHQRRGLSLNKAFISFLEKATGKKEKAQKKKSPHHNLDHLCGIWTKREAEEFTKNIQFQRTIDEELWKNAKS